MTIFPYPRGFTHVSDHATHALDDWRSPRISTHGESGPKRPFTSICADFAGKNVLNTPIGRLPMPGAIVNTNGAMKSHQLSTMVSVADSTVSTAVERASPERSKCAAITGNA